MLYIDVTETRKNGLNTGIQRVVKEMSKELNLIAAQCTFVFFDNWRFQKVTFEEFSGELKNYNNVSRTKVFLRNKFPLLKKIAYPTFKFLQTHITSIRTLPYSILSKNKINFSKGDTLLLLDSNWSRNSKFKGVLKKIKNKVRVIMVCYDLIPVTHPEFLTKEHVRIFTKFKLFAIENIREFICISKFTAKQLESFISEKGYDINKYKINWFHLGFSLKSDLGLKEEKKIKDPYLLSVSTIEPRKNYGLLVDAFQTANISKDIKLVIVGADGWKNNEVVEKIKKSDRIIWLKKVNDHELANLYKNSLFFVFPSYVEGYGLPVLEATCFGKLAISSDSGSLPEVVGDFADYFDPYDKNALIGLIEKYCNNSDLLLEKENKILKEFKAPTWRDSATTLISKLELL